MRKFRFNKFKILRSIFINPQLSAKFLKYSIVHQEKKKWNTFFKRCQTNELNSSSLVSFKLSDSYKAIVTKKREWSAAFYHSNVFKFSDLKFTLLEILIGSGFIDTYTKARKKVISGFVFVNGKKTVNLRQKLKKLDHVTISGKRKAYFRTLDLKNSKGFLSF